MSTPPEGQPPAQEPPKPQGVPTPKEFAEGQQAGKQDPEQPKTFSQEYVHELREEAKQNRLRAQEREQELEQLRQWKEEQERAALSEDERFQLEFQETQERLQAEAARAAEYQLQYEVALRAGRLGIQDPQDAVRLLDWDALEFDERGEVANMDDVLNKLIKSKPYLCGTVQAVTPVVTGNPSAERAPGAELTIEQIRQMRPEEINARWAEIEPILAAQGRR
jgi:hypothetical protein